MPRNRRKVTPLLNVLTSQALTERPRRARKRLRQMITDRLTLGRLSAPKGRAGVGRAQGGPPNPRGRGMTQVIAPAAQGTVFTGTRFAFSAAPPHKGMEGVRITAKQVWATCGSASSGLNALLPFAASAGAAVNSLSFDPNDSKTMPPPLTSLSQVFGRYCLRRCKILFTPGGAGAVSTNGIGLTIAVSSDAALPTPSTTALGMLQLSHSVSGPTWEPMSLDVPVDEEMRYIFQSTSDGSLTDAEDRQDHAFRAYALFDATPTASTTYGFFHIEYVLDLYEISVPPLETSLRKAYALLADHRPALLAGERKLPPVERKETSPRASEDSSPSAADHVAPQARPASGWTVLSLDGGLRRLPKPADPPLRAASTKS